MVQQALETKQAETKSGKAVCIEKAGAAFTQQEMKYAPPKGHEVLIKVAACGVCHSDSFAKEGHFPGIKYPIVPGHEIAGTVEAVGSEVKRLKKGDRVGVGWHGGHCGQCDSCRSGDFVVCAELQVPGLSVDGGYAQYAVFPESVCASIPEGLSFHEAAPLLCAGVTTFNALRHSGAKPGDVVAILGIGGLGHLGVQFAKKMGFYTVAIARGDDKEKFAKELGADKYINSESKDAVKVLNDLGGAKVVLATAANSKAMSPWIDALGVDGKLLIVGADVESLTVSPVQLIGKRRQVAAWPSGTGKDSEDCMLFAARFGIKPMIEKYPFDKAAEAYEHMTSGKARFRAVIDLT